MNGPCLYKLVEKIAADGNSPWVAAANVNYVFHRIAWVTPGLFALISVPIITRSALPFAEQIAFVLEKTAEIYLVLAIASIISALLNTTETRFRAFSLSRKYTIKSYLQVTKIFLFLIAAVFIVSIIMGKSPFYLLTGLGAMTAIGMLVFRDSILGFVTSIHLSANDIIRIGDWVEIAKFGVDGNVIDISLTTIKIQNFDKSIISIPSNAISSDGVKNWRAMMQSGCRRFKRHLTINVDSVRFCSTEQIEHLSKLPLLKERLQQYLNEDSRHTDDNAAKLLNADQRCLTNLTLYRLYLEAYLVSHPRVAPNFTLVVRELQNENFGIPIEVCLFLNVNESSAYEAAQSDIFDFAYSVLGLFELRAYQSQD
jgi:miniconductance mechanosensitive channel